VVFLAFLLKGQISNRLLKRAINSILSCQLKICIQNSLRLILGICEKMDALCQMIEVSGLSSIFKFSFNPYKPQGPLSLYLKIIPFFEGVDAIELYLDLFGKVILKVLRSEYFTRIRSREKQNTKIFRFFIIAKKRSWDPFLLARISFKEGKASLLFIEEGGQKIHIKRI